MRFVSLIMLSLIAFAAPAVARQAVPDPATALDAWVDAVESGDAQNVVKLYDPKAAMISSFAQHPIYTREALFGYYKQVVSNPDVQVKVTDLHSRRFGTMAINTGEYTLSFTQEGEEVDIPARFSFVYILDGGKWMIVDHHSSRVPLPDEIK